MQISLKVLQLDCALLQGMVMHILTSGMTWSAAQYRHTATTDHAGMNNLLL